MFSTVVPLLLFVFVTFNGSNAALQTNKKIFCMYGTPSFDKYDDGRFNVQNIKTEYCTHLIYGNIEIDVDGTIQSTNPPFDFGINDEKGNIRIFNEKKKSDKNLKTLFFVGASYTASGYYTKIFKSEENQNRFVESSIEFAVQNNFDGVILNWRWTRTADELSVDKMSLTSLLKKLKPELEKRNMLLVVSCINFVALLTLSFDIEEVVTNVDYIMVDALHYKTYWKTHIRNYAGIYSPPREHDRLLRAEAGISEWINLGCPPEKILISITLAGIVFTLAEENETKPRSPFIELGSTSKYLNYDGGITYMTLCQKLSNESWTIKWEDTQNNPYAFNGNQWVGYENEKSLEYKAKYVIENNLGGVVTAGQSYDDFKGLCGEKYPLHRVLNSILRPIDESSFEYVVNIHVYERNLDDLSNQCVYHTSKILPL